MLLKTTLTLTLFILSGCSMFGGGDDKSAQEQVEQQGQMDEKVTSESDLPAPTRTNTVQFGSTLVKSISNNKLTSRTVKGRAAADLARSLCLLFMID